MVGALTTSVDAAHKNIDTVDDRFGNLEHRPNASTMDRTVSKTSGTSSQHIDEEWRAIIIHCRGQAPFGRAETNMISRVEAEHVQAQILDRVPEVYKPRVKFLSHYMKNHSVSAEILAAGVNGAKLISDLINLELQKRPIMVTNVEIKGAFETSPGRRRAIRSNFDTRDIAKSMNPTYVFEECSRSLALWDSTACIRLGYVDRKAEDWVWDVIACATVGINIPADSSGDNNSDGEGGGNVTPRPAQHGAPEQQAAAGEPAEAVDVEAMDERSKEVIDFDKNAEGGDATKRAATPKEEDNNANKKQRVPARSITQ